MPIEPTDDLVEALNRFDPLRPLHAGPELQSFYVARPHSPLHPLTTYLRISRVPRKILFMGHRGSGKSTELAKLATELSDRFVVIQFHASRVLNINDMEPVDVVLGSCLAVLEECQKRGVAGLEGLFAQVEEWLRNEVQVEKVGVKTQKGEGGVSLRLLIAELTAKFSAESSTRRVLRPRIQALLSDMAAHVNRVIEAQEAFDKPLLLLVEDLDKTSLLQASKVFFQEGQLLHLLKCHAVYTFPIALRYSNDYPQIRQGFDLDFRLPNININHRDGSQDDGGRATLRDLVLRRAHSSLFVDSALDRIIELSGGLVVDLIRLLQGAVLWAITEDALQVTSEMVDSVAAGVRSDFKAILRSEQYSALREASSRHGFVNEDVIQQVLHNLSLLEYRNSEDWCDVHPIVRPLLELQR